MAEALAPFKESLTPMLAFSATMLGLVLLTLPLMLLFEKLKDRYNQKRAGARRVASSESQNEEDLGDEYEVIELVNRFTQVDACKDLYEILPVSSADAFGGSSVESLVERPVTTDRSTSPIKETDPAAERFLYKRPIRQESVLSQQLLFLEMDAATQTSYFDFDVARDCRVLPEVFEMVDTKIITGRAARYQPSISSNRIICPRKPSRDKFRSRNQCCDTQESRVSTQSDKNRWSFW